MTGPDSAPSAVSLHHEPPLGSAQFDRRPGGAGPPNSASPVAVDPMRLPAPHPQVIHQALPDGAVLFSTVDEVYFGLNAVASRVWALLAPGIETLDELCAALQVEYPDVPPHTIRADVVELLEQLEASGLIVPACSTAFRLNASAVHSLQIAPAPAR